MSLRLLDARDLQGDGLHGVSISLAAGELCLLLGPPKSGKSALLRQLAGVVVPAQGRVRLEGEDLDGLEVDRVARQVGFAVVEPLLHPPLRLRSALLHAAHLRSGGSAPQARVQQAVERALDRVGLRERGGTRVRGLSPPEALRARLALELLTEPKVLLVDAPPALSPALQSEALELGRAEAAAGRAVLAAVTSSAGLLAEDRIAVLADGHLVWDGPLGNALTHFDLSAPDQLLPALRKDEPREWAQRYRASSWQRFGEAV
ncbi:MAG TPA: hypothetical protein DEA08_27805 [Planctomycetes bacterium]|nr:hypothetical protein [Planctomycetota bacterium]